MLFFIFARPSELQHQSRHVATSAGGRYVSDSDADAARTAREQRVENGFGLIIKIFRHNI